MSFLQRTVKREYKQSINAPVEKVRDFLSAMMAPLMPVGRAGSRDPPRHAYVGEAESTFDGY